MKAIAELSPLAARLVRAVELEVEPNGADSWIVAGGERSHFVSLASGCDCLDRRIRAMVACKHELSVHLFQADPALRAAVAKLAKAVEQQVQANV